MPIAADRISRKVSLETQAKATNAYMIVWSIDLVHRTNPSTIQILVKLLNWKGISVTRCRCLKVTFVSAQ